MPFKKTFWQIERFVVYRVLHANDTPHRLALGIALGLFISWTPTIGLQMVLVLLAASVFKAKRIVGLPIVWISNPLTAVPIYYMNYAFGRFLIGLFGDRPMQSYEQVESAFSQLYNNWGRFYEIQFWKMLSGALVDMSLEIWVGSVIIGVVLGLIGYIVSYKVIVWYRLHSPLFRLRRLRLARRQKSRNDEFEKKIG